MTDPLDTLRALEAAATPGPWHADEGFGGVWVVTGAPTDFAVHPHEKDTEYAVLARGDYGASYKDADLVVAMRNALPALLTIAEAAQELLAVDWHADAPVPSVATLTFDFRGDRSALARAVEALLAASTAKATL